MLAVHNKNFFFCCCCGAATQRGSWPPNSWGFYITHNDAPQSVGLLWTSDQLVAETSTWQHKHSQRTNIHALSGIRTHDLSRRAAADLRLRPRGHWDRHINGVSSNRHIKIYLTCRQRIYLFHLKCLTLRNPRLDILLIPCTSNRVLNLSNFNNSSVL
jgi:hypothetical protein